LHLLLTSGLLVISPIICHIIFYQVKSFGAVIVLLTCLLSLGASLLQSTSRFQFNLLDAVITLFGSWFFLSIFWATNQSEAIINACINGAVVVSYFCFRITNNQLSQQKFKLIDAICWLALALAIFFVAEGIYWLIKLVVEIGFFTNLTYGASLLLVHKNTYSNFLLLLSPFLIYGITANRFNKQAKLIALITLVLITIIIIIYQSRTALMTLTILYAIYFWFSAMPLKRKLLMGLSVILIVIIALIVSSKALGINLSTFFEKLNLTSSTANSTFYERLALWNRTSELSSQNFLFGVGAGNWIIMLPTVGLFGIKTVTENNVLLTHPHNDFIWILSELGLIGLTIFLSLFAIAFQACKTMFTKTSNRHIVTLILSFSICYLFISCFTSPHNLLFLKLLLMLILAHVQLNWPPLFKTKPKTLITLTIISSAIMFFPLISNSKGHFSMQNMQALKQKKDWQGIYNLINENENIFFNTSNNGVPIRFYKANAAQKKGEISLAINLLKKSLKTHPNNLSVLLKLGNIHKNQQLYTLAKQYYETALKVNPQNKFLALQLSNVLIELKDYKNAKNWLQGINNTNKRKQKLLEKIKELEKPQH